MGYLMPVERSAHMGFGPFGGMQIIQSHHWPMVPDGFGVKRIAAHPLIHWLARRFPIKPWIEAQVPRFKDADPMIDQRRGVIYCSPAQFAELRRGMAHA